MSTNFRARRDTFGTKTLAAGYGILIVCVGGPLIAGSITGDLRFGWFMLIPAAIIVFMFSVLTSALLKRFIRFSVSEEALLITMPPGRGCRIHRRDIANVAILDAEQSASVFEKSIREQLGLKEEGDLAGYVRLLRRKAPEFRYLSVAPSARVTTRGQTEQLNSLEVRSRERMVCLTLTNGKNLYLSPDDVEGFADHLNPQ